jgi:hypothetical protein
MLSIVATVGWILFDVAISLWTAPMMPAREWWAFLVGGVSLGLVALVGEIAASRANQRERSALMEEIADLKNQQIRQEGITMGGFAALGGKIDIPITGVHLTDRMGPVLEYDNNTKQARLLILNPGPQADFYAVFDISGMVSGERTSRLYCKWSHTDAVRMKLARGETGEIFLAQLKWEIDKTMSTATWEIYATSESGPRTIKAIHSSMAQPQVHRAADILIRGKIFADPESPQGALPFAVVLTAFGAQFPRPPKEES